MYNQTQPEPETTPTPEPSLSVDTIFSFYVELALLFVVAAALVGLLFYIKNTNISWRL